MNQGMRGNEQKSDRILVSVGVLMLVLEIWKQITIWKVEYKGSYDIWYFPFQLCSTPMYMLLIYGLIGKTDKAAMLVKKSILTFIEDYGMLGGIMALIVHEGLIHKGYMLLTIHGFIWHIIMVLLSLYIFLNGLSYRGNRGFLRTVPLFLGLSCIAFSLNVLLHRYGDCDMFYISPYHNSSQMIYHDIDKVIGRPVGIVVYLISIVVGAYVIHKMFDIVSARRDII